MFSNVNYSIFIKECTGHIFCEKHSLVTEHVTIQYEHVTINTAEVQNDGSLWGVKEKKFIISRNLSLKEKNIQSIHAIYGS